MCKRSTLCSRERRYMNGKYLLYVPIDSPSLVIYGNALAFTTNSIFPQLLTKISTIKHFQISYIYNENHTTFARFSLVTSPTVVPSEWHIFDSLTVDTCTPGVPIFNKEFKPFLHNHFKKWKKYSSRVEEMFEQNRI